MHQIKLIVLLASIASLAACGNIEVVSAGPAEGCTTDSDCQTSISCEIGVCNKSKGTCNYSVVEDKCLINDVCYNSGQEEPGVPCNVCRPELDEFGFVKKLCEEGQSCDAKNGECVGSSSDVCGDGALATSEGCDDGNTNTGDGCSDACVVEDGYTCAEAGVACVDVDECGADTSPCGANATCTNEPGTFSCACNEGFEGDGETCTDIDECAADTSPCKEDEICTNTDGSFSCEPIPTVEITFSVDMSCSGLAEFSAVAISGPFSEWCGGCHPLTDEDGDNIWTGTFEFKDGEVVEYKYIVDNFDGQEDLLDDVLSGGECAPVTDSNEYANRQVTASADVTINDTYGTCKTCDTVCEPGFDVAVGGACADIDECAAEVSPCEAANTACSNTEGSYECPCANGFLADEEGACQDIDECGQTEYFLNQTFDDVADSDGWKTEDEESVFTVENGIMVASISAGVGASISMSPATSDLLPGTTISFDFAFNQPVDGFIFDWWTCKDPQGSEECTKQVQEQVYDGKLGVTTLMSEADISPEEMEIGVLTNYEFTLPQATPGFLLIFAGTNEEGKVWSIDNFQIFANTTPCGVNGTCDNTDGGYQCTCDKGYELGEAGSCDDIDECASGNIECGDNASCINSPGSYACACDEGYEGDGYSCCPIDKNGYSPCGPQVNVPVKTVQNGGWEICLKDPYSNTLNYKDFGDCQGADMMLACRETGSDTIKLLAWAPMEDVMTETGPPGIEPGENSDVTHTANKTAWYNGINATLGSIGFAKGGDKVNKFACDLEKTGNEKMRLCWHLSPNFGGYRCGDAVGLNNDASWERLVFVRN